jgi:Glu-tRNA(Gln) amidotransferase subunit E-like FAD-binding protein
MNQNFVHGIQATLLSAPTNDYIHTFKLNDLFNNLLTTPANCTAPGALLYIQFSCEQDVELLRTKFRQLSLVSSLSVFIACLFMIVIYFYKKSSTLQQLEWDMSTITPGDYTLQMEITTNMWNYFLKEVYEKNDMEAQGISRAYALKTYLKNEVEKILSEALLKHKQEHPEEMKSIKISQVKIADVAFAFNNAELINLLRERGGHIVRQKYD